MTRRGRAAVTAARGASRGGREASTRDAKSTHLGGRVHGPDANSVGTPWALTARYLHAP